MRQISLMLLCGFGAALGTQALAQSPATPPPPPLIRGVNCATYFYPVAAAAQRQEGTTVVRMVIGTDGIPKDVAVDQSSGSVMLDDAAVACVRTFRYSPPMLDGKPVEVPGHPTIVWKMADQLPPPSGNEIATRDTPGVTLPKLVRNINCAARFYPQASAVAREQGDATVDMILGVDGVPRSVAILKSSGYPRLDQAALGCVKEFRYSPALKDGQPVEFRGFPMVIWRIH